MAAGGCIAHTNGYPMRAQAHTDIILIRMLYISDVMLCKRLSARFKFLAIALLAAQGIKGYMN